jgi:hypothetical protein
MISMTASPDIHFIRRAIQAKIATGISMAADSNRIVDTRRGDFVGLDRLPKVAIILRRWKNRRTIIFVVVKRLNTTSIMIAASANVRSGESPVVQIGIFG